MKPEVNKYYWVRLYRNDAPWQPARRIVTDYSDLRLGWSIFGVEVDYYDTEVNEVGPEIVPPAE